MAANGARNGNGTARDARQSAEQAELQTTRIVSRAGAATAGEAEDDGRYDFLDAREPEFLWQPVTGKTRPGEAEVATAPTWLERSRAFRRRSALHGVLAWLLTLVVIAAIAAGAFTVLSGRLGQLPGMPASTGAKPPAAAPTAPAPTAPAPAAAQPPAASDSPVQDAGKDTPLETPAMPPPPGGEDGPPAPEPGAPPRGER